MSVITDQSVGDTVVSLQVPDRKTDKERRRKKKEERERERENSNSNMKTLFYKDCSLGSVKNLTTSPC